MDLFGPIMWEHDPEAARRAAGPLPRRSFVLGAAVFLGSALTAGCTTQAARMCYEERRAGQKGRVLAATPCPDEAD